MQLWKSILAYDGSAFHGWQVQPGLPTIQGALAQALRHVTGETVLPQGSGRTDAGVHALAQVVSFSLAVPIPGANLLRALNRILPAAVRVLSLEHATPSDPPFHARHSARRKTYEYRIFPRLVAFAPGEPRHPDRICPPFLAPYVWDYNFPFSLDLARRASAHVLGTQDFTSFAATDPDLAVRTNSAGEPTSNIRTVYSSDWTHDPVSGLFLYRVTGSGFLHHMVRNLVGTFAAAASARICADAIPGILAARHRSAAGATAPARGLFLAHVDYEADR
jgi:tRNA pseudouridine38-40 synthase